MPNSIEYMSVDVKMKILSSLTHWGTIFDFRFNQSDYNSKKINKKKIFKKKSYFTLRKHLFHLAGKYEFLLDFCWKFLWWLLSHEVSTIS